MSVTHPLGFHVVLRLGDDRVIAPSHAERLVWARCLAAHAQEMPIVAWKLADTHLHIVIVATAEEVAELIRRLRIWVTRALNPGVPLELQRRKPLAGQSHLESTFSYVLRQDDHHGLETDVFQDASAVVDILGLRVLSPAVAVRVRERLPRLTRESLLKHLAVSELDEGVHLSHLAADAAAALGQETLGADSAGTRGRRAAVAAAREAGPTVLAGLLGVTPQAVCRMAHAAVPLREIRAVRLQMSLRAARASSEPFAPPGMNR